MTYNAFFKPDYTPPTAFYFMVKFQGFSQQESSFQDVSGLKVTLGTDEKKQGGDNVSSWTFPTQPTYDNLVLKRCLLPNAELEKWCRDAFESFKFETKNIQLALLSADGQILASWEIQGAYPVSWELSPLNSTTNQLAIESLTLKYKFFRKETDDTNH